MQSLDREISTYQRELARLLEEGEADRYVLIQADQVVSTWDTYRDALQYGYERFGDLPFLVQRIDPRDVERLARLSAEAPPPCPS